MIFAYPKVVFCWNTTCFMIMICLPCCSPSTHRSRTPRRSSSARCEPLTTFLRLLWKIGIFQIVWRFVGFGRFWWSKCPWDRTCWRRVWRGLSFSFGRQGLIRMQYLVLSCLRNCTSWDAICLVRWSAWFLLPPFEFVFGNLLGLYLAFGSRFLSPNANYTHWCYFSRRSRGCLSFSSVFRCLSEWFLRSAATRCGPTGSCFEASKASCNHSSSWKSTSSSPACSWTRRIGLSGAPTPCSHRTGRRSIPHCYYHNPTPPRQSHQTH